MTVQRLAVGDDPPRLAGGTSLRTRFSISSIFFINGFVIASWLPHIPEVKERLALGDFQLGMALFSMAAGSVAALPFAGWLTGRLGSDSAVRMAGLLLCVLLTAPVAAPSLPLLMLALLLFGAANGMLDVAMNAQAVEIENRYPRPILSSLHGLYSAGGLVGAGLASVAASAGISAIAHVAGTTGVVALLLLWATRSLTEDETRGTARSAVLAWPSRSLLGLGALAFLAMMAEGAIGDWAAVFLREYERAGMDGAVMGFAGFSLAMAVGRFSGDWVRRRWGGPASLRAGGLIAAFGMALALSAPGLPLSVAGFVVFGLGLANMVPVLFGAAGRAHGTTAGPGIAAVATCGYAGLLGGPPLIGITAEFIGLRLALVSILVALLTVAIFARLVHQEAGRAPDIMRLRRS
jgi:MFS family permease